VLETHAPGAQQRRWLATLLCIWVLAMTAGCPHAFGRGGTIDRAVLKDVMERIRQNCTKAEIERYCQNIESEECFNHCVDVEDE
jgi:hypothetical protein